MAKKTAPAFPTRRTDPDTSFGYTDPDGSQQTFRSDAEGLVSARNVQEENVLVGFGAPIARAKSSPAEPDSQPEPVEEPVNETGVTDASR